MFTLPESVKKLMKVFQNANYNIYLVGGTVRGLLMNKRVDDWDFTTTAIPEQIISLFPNSFYNNNFGTVSIPFKDVNSTLIFQVTTHRKESDYSNVRHPDKISWSLDIEEDLARRDFTINAIASDGDSIIDPFGGLSAIKNKIIKAVGDPETRFNEDALRLLRAVRQSTQLKFEIEKNTFESICDNAKNITQISGERIRDEFFKLIQSENSAYGILTLKKSSLLKYILPELDDCFGVEQKSPNRHHVYDVGTHLVKSLENCTSKDPITRFATLIHDIGKKPTFYKNKETGLITFYNHEVVGEKMASEIADRFRLSKNQKKKLLLLVRNHQFTVTEEQTDKSIRRFINQIGIENIDDMIALRTGDRLGSGAKKTSWRTELFKKRIIEVQKIPFTIKQLKINGLDIMRELGLKQGPIIGTILKDLFDKVESGKIQNSKEILLENIKDFKKNPK